MSKEPKDLEIKANCFSLLSYILDECNGEITYPEEINGKKGQYAKRVYLNDKGVAVIVLYNDCEVFAYKCDKDVLSSLIITWAYFNPERFNEIYTTFMDDNF